MFPRGVTRIRTGLHCLADGAFGIIEDGCYKERVVQSGFPDELHLLYLRLQSIQDLGSCLLGCLFLL
jgi:hypothetical protein